MHKPLAVSVVLLASGCVFGVGRKPVPEGDLGQARADAEGVCAAVDEESRGGWFEQSPAEDLASQVMKNQVRACARLRPGAEGAEDSVLASRFVFAEGDERWRPEHWHVDVTRANGLVIYAGTLEQGEAERGDCVLGVCYMWGKSELRLPEPWLPGVYRIRYAHVPTGKRIDLTITLR